MIPMAVAAGVSLLSEEIVKVVKCRCSNIHLARVIDVIVAKLVWCAHIFVNVMGFMESV